MKPMIMTMAVMLALSAAGCGDSSGPKGMSPWPGAGSNAFHTGEGKGDLLVPFGKEWNTEVPGLGFGAAVIIDVPDNDLRNKKLVSRLVVVTSTDGGMFGIDWDTGEIIWRQKMPGAAGDPLFVGDMVVATCSDGTINAYSAWDGSQAWSSRFRSATAQPDPIWAGRPENAALVADDKRIYSAHSSKTVMAFGISDGKEAWRLDLPDAIMASPVLVGSRLIVADYSMKLNAIDAENGNRLWESPIPDRVTTTLLSDGKIVYIPGSFGKFEAFAIADGKSVWTLDIGGTIGVAPCFAGDFIAIPDTMNGKIHFASKDTGVIKQTVDLKGIGIKSHLVSSNNYICFGSSDGRVIAVDSGRFSHTEAFKFESESLVSANRMYGYPAVLEGRLLISDGISHFYKLIPKALANEPPKETPIPAKPEEKKNP